MSLTKQITKKSKYLSLLLRHDPKRAGIILDNSGWTDVKVLLRAVGWSMEELEEIVSTDEKKRYEFDECNKNIRASQGHSVDVDLGYEIKTPPEYLYHGTSRNNIDSIKINGLLKMSRHAVHMFADKNLASDIANRRRNNPIVLEICSLRMSVDGFQFRLSTNNVWLIDTVPFEYINFDSLI